MNGSRLTGHVTFAPKPSNAAKGKEILLEDLAMLVKAKAENVSMTAIQIPIPTLTTTKMTWQALSLPTKVWRSMASSQSLNTIPAPLSL